MLAEVGKSSIKVNKKRKNSLKQLLVHVSSIRNGGNGTFWAHITLKKMIKFVEVHTIL